MYVRYGLYYTRYYTHFDRLTQHSETRSCRLSRASSFLVKHEAVVRVALRVVVIVVVSERGGGHEMRSADGEERLGGAPGKRQGEDRESQGEAGRHDASGSDLVESLTPIRHGLETRDCLLERVARERRWRRERRAACETQV